MPRLLLNVGTVPNDKTGDTLPTAFNTINSNFITSYKEIIPPGFVKNYYVSTTGNDTNDGLTAATAFATLQKAVNEVYEKIYIGNRARVVIYIADGTYTQATSVGCHNGPGELYIIGNETTPANVIFRYAGTVFTLNWSRNVIIAGIDVGINAGAANYSSCLQYYNSFGFIRNMRFSAVNNSTCRHIYLTDNSQVSNYGSAYVVAGGAYSHIHLENFSSYYIGTTGNSVINSPTFTAFAISGQKSIIYDSSASVWTGTGVVGSRYYAFLSGAINVASGSANHFPGNAAGSVAFNGVYA